MSISVASSTSRTSSSTSSAYPGERKGTLEGNKGSPLQFQKGIRTVPCHIRREYGQSLVILEGREREGLAAAAAAMPANHSHALHRMLRMQVMPGTKQEGLHNGDGGRPYHQTGGRRGPQGGGRTGAGGGHPLRCWADRHHQGAKGARAEELRAPQQRLHGRLLGTPPLRAKGRLARQR